MSDSNQTQFPIGSSGLPQNVVAFLCYVCGFITGIIFLTLEKNNREIRFHAWQSILMSIGLVIVLIGVSIVGAIAGILSSVLGALISLLTPLIFLLFLIAWMLCLMNAYNGTRFVIPVIGDIAEAQAGKF